MCLCGHIFAIIGVVLRGGTQRKRKHLINSLQCLALDWGSLKLMISYVDDYRERFVDKGLHPQI